MDAASDPRRSSGVAVRPGANAQDDKANDDGPTTARTTNSDRQNSERPRTAGTDDCRIGRIDRTKSKKGNGLDGYTALVRRVGAGIPSIPPILQSSVPAVVVAVAVAVAIVGDDAALMSSWVRGGPAPSGETFRPPDIFAAPGQDTSSPRSYSARRCGRAARRIGRSPTP